MMNELETVNEHQVPGTTFFPAERPNCRNCRRSDSQVGGERVWKAVTTFPLPYTCNSHLFITMSTIYCWKHLLG